MTKHQAEKWEKLALEALKDAARSYAIESTSEGVGSVLVAGSRLRLAAKTWHAANVDRTMLAAAEAKEEP